MDLSVLTLRVVTTVAETGSFTAAASSLDYTQSAVSRQVATAERELGTRLFERQRTGVRLTDDGRTLLRHATAALAALDRAEQEIRQPRRPKRRRLRLGHFAAAGSLVAAALSELDRRGLAVTTREGTTPSLVRALRAGTLDVALLTSRPPHRSPDQDDPPLPRRTITDVELVVAVSAHSPLATRSTVDSEELAEQPWVTSRGSVEEPLLGVWPGLPARPAVQHIADDWATKLAFVAAGLAITTVPRGLIDMPDAVTTLEVTDLPVEIRRVEAVAGPTCDADVFRDSTIALRAATHLASLLG